MLGNPDCEYQRTIDIHPPQLAYTVHRIVNGLEVLGEAGRRDQVVDFAMLIEDLRNRFLDRFW
jgi:hypothetical protein